jgi:hypothetical protein
MWKRQAHVEHNGVAFGVRYDAVIGECRRHLIAQDGQVLALLADQWARGATRSMTNVKHGVGPQGRLDLVQLLQPIGQRFDRRRYH